ncbi:mitochondrial dicarboxylate carrier-like isoform X2 [Lineus longissimus]|uniref:mitochondrial dicarboxylate carrier-like isoform X2 n=1 Tax=Lineus longissimus TaxID=88925 RepID=UPI00315D2EA9
MSVDKTKRVGRWYFGGIASAMAACCTHPLDLLKVHLQTQQKATIGLFQMGVIVVKNEGITGLYNGLTASVMRQLTYSLTRFAIYETVKKNTTVPGESMPFLQKVALAGFAGGCGGVVGTPADMVNVRMQNDMKIPKEQRRNYKHAVDGLYRVFREEGPRRLMSGCVTATSRAILMTIGQLAFYDQVKQGLLASGYFKDNIITHFTSSLTAGAIATAMTQPLDVMKTRMMNAEAGQYKNLLHCAMDILKVGPLGFYKGFLPAFVRLGPHTICTFIFLEQMRMNFGYMKPEGFYSGIRAPCTTNHLNVRLL